MKFFNRRTITPTYKHTILALCYKDALSALAFYALCQMSDIEAAETMGEEIIGV